MVAIIKENVRTQRKVENNGMSVHSLMINGTWDTPVMEKERKENEEQKSFFKPFLFLSIILYIADTNTQSHTQTNTHM